MTSNEIGDAASNAQRRPPSDLPEVPLTEPVSSNFAFSSSSFPAPTPAQRVKTSNILQQEFHLPMSEKSDDQMVQLVARKIPQPTSPVRHDHTDTLIPALTPNSNTFSSQPISQTISQLSRLSNHHVQGESIDHENSQTLLQGIMVDLKARECPFFNLLQVREILERTHRHRYST